MSFGFVLYTLIIYPVRQLIEMFYMLFSEASKNQGLSVIGVSLVFTLCCLPLYVVAERWQEKERAIQTRMKDGIKRIKKAFKGDERYMMLTTYYHQMHYHPLMALRSSFGLVIQIPFFIAAYSFLSHLQQLQGASFLFIKDMGKPDALFSIKGFTVNILPVAMTAVNVASGMVYSRGHELREKVQVFVSAALFLVLLYAMPAGLVLYWTMNNIFSLLKNICYKIPRRILIRAAYGTAVLLYVLTVYYLLRVHTGSITNRFFLSAAGAWIPFLPLIVRLGRCFFDTFGIHDDKGRTKLFLLCGLVLSLLLGIVIPSFVIASSPQEFSYIDSYNSPLFFLCNTALQATGFCMFWPVCLYFFFGKRVQVAFCSMALLLMLGALANAFLFSGNYGNISSTLEFNDSPKTNIPFALKNFAALVFVSCAACALVRLRCIQILRSIALIVAMALGAISLYNIIEIQSVYKSVEPVVQLTDEQIAPIYSLSKTRRNIVVLFLDKFTSAFFPEVIKESPGLKGVYEGFVYYPNTISYGLHTIVGAPAMLGGYDYRPEQMNARTQDRLQDKINEANGTLPLLFNSLGFEVTFTNPKDIESTADFLSAYPEIHTPNTNGTYRQLWYTRHGNDILPVKSTLLKRDFIWLSFFKSAPVFLRKTIYKRRWWSSQRLQDTDDFIDSYSALDFLPELTSCTSERDTFMFIGNMLPHDPMYLDAPAYTLPKGGGGHASSASRFGGVADFYSAAASIHLVAAWLDHLKANGVYDNTRIIIVSDHGFLINTGVFKGNTVCQVEGCNPLLLVKDFGTAGELREDHAFMTQCDVPALAVKDVLPFRPDASGGGGYENPVTGRLLSTDGKRGVQKLFMNHNNTAKKNGTYTYTAKPEDWYCVHDDIFVPENWSRP